MNDKPTAGLTPEDIYKLYTDERETQLDEAIRSGEPIDKLMVGWLECLRSLVEKYCYGPDGEPLVKF